MTAVLASCVSANGVVGAGARAGVKGVEAEVIPCAAAAAGRHGQGRDKREIGKQQHAAQPEARSGTGYTKTAAVAGGAKINQQQ